MPPLRTLRTSVAMPAAWLDVGPHRTARSLKMGRVLDVLVNAADAIGATRSKDSALVPQLEPPSTSAIRQGRATPLKST